MVNLLINKGQATKVNNENKEEYNNVVIDRSENTLIFYATNEEYNKILNFIQQMIKHRDKFL